MAFLYVSITWNPMKGEFNPESVFHFILEKN